MRYSLTVLALAAAGVLGFAGPYRNAQAAPQRMQVDSLRSLLVAAIDSPSGEASGELAGETIRAISQRFQTTAPLLVDVSTVHRFKQPGCSRLNVKLSQQGVQLPQPASAQDRALEIGLNYCRDGAPPASLD